MAPVYCNVIQREFWSRDMDVYLTHIRIGKILTQFVINFSRQEHQIDVLHVSFNSWDSQVSAYTPFHISFTVPLTTAYTPFHISFTVPLTTVYTPFHISFTVPLTTAGHLQLLQQPPFKMFFSVVIGSYS